MTKLLKWLLVAAFFNAICWIVVIPLWQYPDEQAHFAQTQDLAEVGYVPIGVANTSYEIAASEEILGTARDEFGNNKFTYHPEYKIPYSQNLFGPNEEQITNLNRSSRTDFVKVEATNNPPLYYNLAKIFYKLANWGNLFDRVYATRFFSVILFTATVFLSFKIGQIVFLPNPILPYILTSFMAFNPMFVFSSTGAIPDPLTNFLYTTIIYLCLMIIKNGISTTFVLLSAVVVTLGVLTRQNFLTAIFLLIFPVVYQTFKNPKSFVKVTLSILLMAVFIVMATTYGRVIPVISSFRFGPDTGFAPTLFFQDDFITYLKFITTQTYAQIWPWYWGVYKWLSLTYPPIIYQIINRLTMIVTIGLILKFLTIAKSRKFKDEDINLIFFLYAAFIYYAVFILWDYLFWVKNGFSFGIQGRYFFPIIVVHMAIIINGFWIFFTKLWPKIAVLAQAVLAVSIVAFNNFALSFLAASFYDLSHLNNFIVQASQYKPLIFKGNMIIFILLFTLLLQVLYLRKIFPLALKSR